MAQGAFVAYYRVSTARQGASGLGLEAQKEAVRRHLNGGGWSIRSEFVEVESGRKNDRPALEKALAAARLHRVPLIVANVSRLTRSNSPTPVLVHPSQPSSRPFQSPGRGPFAGAPPTPYAWNETMTEETPREVTVTFTGSCKGNPGPGSWKAHLWEPATRKQDTATRKRR